VKPVNRYNWILPDWPLFLREKGPARQTLEVWNVLGRNHNIGTIRTRVILHAHEHLIKSLSSLVEIIGLEIERCLREAVFIGKVVVCIDDIERIRNGRRDVITGGRVLSKVRGIDKVKAGRALGGNSYELRALVRDSVVAASPKTPS